MPGRMLHDLEGGNEGLRLAVEPADHARRLAGVDQRAPRSSAAGATRSRALLRRHTLVPRSSRYSAANASAARVAWPGRAGDPVEGDAERAWPSRGWRPRRRSGRAPRARRRPARPRRGSPAPRGPPGYTTVTPLPLDRVVYACSMKLIDEPSREYYAQRRRPRRELTLAANGGATQPPPLREACCYTPRAPCSCSARRSGSTRSSPTSAPAASAPSFSPAILDRQEGRDQGPAPADRRRRRAAAGAAPARGPRPPEHRRDPDRRARRRHVLHRDGVRQGREPRGGARPREVARRAARAQLRRADPEGRRARARGADPAPRPAAGQRAHLGERRPARSRTSAPRACSSARTRPP